jgi:hypothetical protein
VVEPNDGVDLRPSLVRACTAGGWEVYELGYERLSLEEAFSILTEAPPKKERRREDLPRPDPRELGVYFVSPMAYIILTSCSFSPARSS